MAPYGSLLPPTAMYGSLWPLWLPRVTYCLQVYLLFLFTWEQLPYLEVLESVHKTAEAGSSIRTFLYRSKLPRLEVLRSCCKTADLGSSTVDFQYSQPIFCKISQNCRPWKFYGPFSVLTPSRKLKMLQNCQPRKFYGHFCVFSL